MEKLPMKKGVFKRAFSRYRRRRGGYFRGMTLRNDTNYVKVEYYDTILSASSVSTHTFQDTGTTFVSIATLIHNSSSFSNYSSIYQQYMITGIKLTYYPTYDLAGLRAIYGRACPIMFCMISTNHSNQNLGDAPKYNDNTFCFSPGSTEMSSKYYRFPEGYSTSSIGFGSWNTTSNYLNQVGQLSICQGETGNNANGPHNIAGIRTIIYIKFKNRNT